MKLIANPLSKNNYDYLNELLDNNSKKHTAESLNDKEERNQLIQKLQRQQQELKVEQVNAANTEEQNHLIEANLLKLKRTLEMLQDEAKKLKYDAALANPPSVKLEVEGKDSNQQIIIALVPIEDIIKEFEDFKNMKDADGKLLIPEGCKYERLEGPPAMHVFTFPDEKSKNDFLQILFNKNLAMLPNGSQSLEKTPIQQSMKNQLDSFRRPQENEQKDVRPSKP